MLLVPAVATSSCEDEFSAENVALRRVRTIDGTVSAGFDVNSIFSRPAGTVPDETGQKFGVPGRMDA